MSRRSGQSGSVVKKGLQWHVRIYVDVPGQEKRQRRSLPIGPCVGEGKLNRNQAKNKAKQLIAKLGINTEEHLKRAIGGMYTFRDRVDWCRKNKQAWTKGKPGPIETMESALRKHILPFFGDLPLDDVNDQRVQEFITHLQNTLFERRKPKGPNRQPVGDVIKTYQLRDKTIENYVGLVKLIMGKKASRDWELDLGKTDEDPEQRVFTVEEMEQICELAIGQYKVLFTLLKGTGLRIGEACGLQVPDLYLPDGADEKDGFLFVRRSFSERAKANGGMVTPKSKKGRRTVDFDEEVTTALREHLKGRTTGLVFQARNGKPLRSGNLVKRVLNPILRKLGIPTGGRVNHAFRHGRVTELRKAGVADDTILQWIGHAVTATTDGYSHLDRDLKFRREQLAKLKQ